MVLEFVSPWPELDKKNALQFTERVSLGVLAEAVRFELTDPCESTVFKTVAIDHSATLPRGEIVAI